MPGSLLYLLPIRLNRDHGDCAIVRVIVHGGAGGSTDKPEPRQAVLSEAASDGADQATPLEAVETAIRRLESNTRFNAGVGGAIQSDGIVRTDAGVMTDNREAGAACSMPSVEHAVSVARVVLEDTPHVMISGVHAVDLAADVGIDTEVDLLTQQTRERLHSEDPPQGSPQEQLDWLQSRFGSGGDQAGGSDTSADVTETLGSAPDDASGESGDRDAAPDHDTVGAVAGDGDTFAAATSTGGRSFALAGRVGDVPQIGSGFYCSPAGGASATGAGEDIARVIMSRDAVTRLEDGADPETAAREAIDEFEALTDSGAGIIVLDESGTGSAFNTDSMQTAIATDLD